MAKKHNDKPGLPADKFLPIVIDSAASAQKVADAETVVIFSIDGVDYSMPKVERADLALRYIELEGTEGGEGEASAYLLRETIGPEAITALANVVGLESKAFEGVMVRVQAIALPKGKRPGKGAEKL